MFSCKAYVAQPSQAEIGQHSLAVDQDNMAMLDLDLKNRSSVLAVLLVLRGLY